MATPTLIGLDASDDPTEVMPTCGIDPIWSGLALVDFAIVPHGGDSLLEDPQMTARTVAALTTAGAQFTVLTDQEAIVVER